MKKSTIKKVGKLRKQQDLVKCLECGKLCKTGGLVNHIRLLHHKVYQIIPKAATGILISDQMIGNVAVQVIDQLDGAAERYAAEWDNFMKPQSRYTEAIRYYRNHPESARVKWAEMQNKKFSWSVRPDLMLALRRLCEPTEEDLYHIRSMGKDNYWDV